MHIRTRHYTIPLMTKQSIYIGNKKACFNKPDVQGTTVTIDGETYFKISNSDGMRPFFMSLISDSNHWMFISSNGGLSAGRQNSDNALFPYYTDDKITESIDHTGSKTILRVSRGGNIYLWEPFSNRYPGVYDITRNLYKNVYGNKLIFEEENKDLDLTYKYHWNTSDIYGFVKKSELLNTGSSPLNISLLDGLQNILPYGVGEDLQKASSNLVDAYKRNELLLESGLGVFALSAIIVDKAEPSEALKSNIVWSLGLQNPTYLVSSKQLNHFRQGGTLVQETDIKAERGAYFVVADVSLDPSMKKDWLFVADLNQNASAVTATSQAIVSSPNLRELIELDIEKGTQHLLKLAGASDAMQLSDNTLRNARHFSNTLFNIMRGGIFDNNYTIEKWDFDAYLKKANTAVYTSHQYIIEGLATTFTLGQLKEVAAENENQHFKRLCSEYMPLKFSRRHGDPSRPWNKFSINTRNELDGSKVLDYQGNWRDIFQNWEALALSYPDFIESMIHKFLNATTFDGYNPYRVTKDGFDWETIEEDDPWSYIGYWGDHQIIYLQKFLEIIENHTPGRLESYFNQNLFVYANVPYKIKSYQDILKNPKDTIDFDFELDEIISKRREKQGVDGALLRDTTGIIHNVNFIEKILATVLAKVSNFIPEAGIWLNTQRPEWNDANNALVGNGVSMVTLYYLRRFLKFFGTTLENSSLTETKVSKELHSFFSSVVETLDIHKNTLDGSISDKDRKSILDGLGLAGSAFRNTIYTQEFSGEKNNLSLLEISSFVQTTLAYIDHTIDANQREDKLYHAYNLMTLSSDTEVAISYLDEMLEGQVSVLSSGYLSPKENLAVLDALKSSALFREDQYSYILYPNKNLPKFLEKNTIPKKTVLGSSLFQELLNQGDTRIIEKDSKGKYHFNGNFNNATKLNDALDHLSDSGYNEHIKKERQYILDTYEQVFNHKAFTGRSGTFYGYEGLGSIYWHMVSKLLLAVQECCLQAINQGDSDEVVGKLLEHYYEINAGIGVQKSPELYGAFPTDPYSHTPGGKGAQQPGMTGQVKEDILSRFGELGVFVKEGSLQFSPDMLRKSEFLTSPQEFAYVDLSGKTQQTNLEVNSLGFTYCQVPVIYKMGSSASIRVNYQDGTAKDFTGKTIDKETSRALFHREGVIKDLQITIDESILK